MKLVWAQHALEDRETIFSYLEEENPVAAIHIDDQISGAAKRLRDFPKSGRPGRVPGTRELVISHTPYIAVYTIQADQIRMLRILHGAQQWPGPDPAAS